MSLLGDWGNFIAGPVARGFGTVIPVPPMLPNGKVNPILQTVSNVVALPGTGLVGAYEGISLANKAAKGNPYAMGAAGASGVIAGWGFGIWNSGKAAVQAVNEASLPQPVKDAAKSTAAFGAGILTPIVALRYAPGAAVSAALKNPLITTAVAGVVAGGTVATIYGPKQVAAIKVKAAAATQRSKDFFAVGKVKPVSAVTATRGKSSSSAKGNQLGKVKARKPTSKARRKGKNTKRK